MEQNTKQLTSDDIEQLQIIATTKDSEHLLTTSDSALLIKIVTGTCAFIKLKKEIFEQCSLKEIIE